MIIKQILAKQITFIRWVSFGSYGMALGILAAAVIEIALGFLFGHLLHLDSPIWEMVPFIISGFTLGAFLGAFQSRTLKHEFAHPLLWTLISSIGFAIGVPCVAYLYIKNILPETFFSGLGMGAIIGLALGFAQWLVIRTRADRSGLWVLGNVIGGVFSAGIAYILLILYDLAFPTQYFPTPPGIVNMILDIVTGILNLVFIFLLSPLAICFFYNVSIGIMIKRHLDICVPESQKAG